MMEENTKGEVLMQLTLWTIQHTDAYKAFMHNGVLRANEDFLFCEDDLRFAYDWMAQQLAKKIGPPPLNVNYPIWAWYQWEGKKARRDLRFSGYAPRGTPMVQIEFEVDSDYVLLSDFDDWNLVLNNSYIADSENEFESFYAMEYKDENERIEGSWRKIFDIEKEIPGWTTPLDKKTIQATLWEVRLEQVKKVQWFIAK